MTPNDSCSTGGSRLTGVVSEIEFQASLVALNAAIEAAGAGAGSTSSAPAPDENTAALLALVRRTAGLGSRD
jgi:hypothetical protein